MIVEMNASVEAIEGSHVSLLCGADSNPLPLLTWMRDGSVLREAVAESLFLDLEEVTPAEDGVYACLAENAYGQDNRTVGLSVMCEWRPRGDEGKPPPPQASGGAGGPEAGGGPPCAPRTRTWRTPAAHHASRGEVGRRRAQGSWVDSGSCGQPWLEWE